MSGTVTLSIELELGWGTHDMDVFPHLSDDRDPEETAFFRLLKMCEKYNIEVSFDIVGHLYEESCDGSHIGPYPDLWWENDPGTSLKSDPHFYAPNMITSILESTTNHEISTHTYSHILAEEVSNSVLRHELQLVQELHSRWNIPMPSSIVMPRHQTPDYSILSEFGIEVIRQPIQDYRGSDLNPIKKGLWILTRDHPRCEINTNRGIVETTCTPHPSLSGPLLPSGQRKPPWYFQTLPQSVRERMHTQYLTDALERAAETESHVHLWTHLHNMANDSQWKSIKPAFERLAELRENGDVDVYRMCDLPELV